MMAIARRKVREDTSCVAMDNGDRVGQPLDTGQAQACRGLRPIYDPQNTHVQGVRLRALLADNAREEIRFERAESRGLEC